MQYRYRRGTTATRNTPIQATPRWVREHERFDRAHLDLIDRHIQDMTSQIMQARLDILDGTARLSFEISKQRGEEN